MFTDKEIIVSKYDGHAGNSAGDSMRQDSMGRLTTSPRFSFFPPGGGFGPNFHYLCRASGSATRIHGTGTPLALLQPT
jgi:hypothetical protein